MIQLAIVGSRGYPDLEAVWDFVASLPDGFAVVSGGAAGVDATAALAAKACGLPVTEIRPDYARYPGRVAPIMRNIDIVAAADAVCAWWHKRTKGTGDAIERAAAAKKPLLVITSDARGRVTRWASPDWDARIEPLLKAQVAA